MPSSIPRAGGDGEALSRLVSPACPLKRGSSERGLAATSLVPQTTTSKPAPNPLGRQADDNVPSRVLARNVRSSARRAPPQSRDARAVRGNFRPQKRPFKGLRKPDRWGGKWFGCELGSISRAHRQLWCDSRKFFIDTPAGSILYSKRFGASPLQTPQSLLSLRSIL